MLSSIFAITRIAKHLPRTKYNWLYNFITDSHGTTLIDAQLLSFTHVHFHVREKTLSCSSHRKSGIGSPLKETEL